MVFGSGQGRESAMSSSTLTHANSLDQYLPLTGLIPGNKKSAQTWTSFITHAPKYMQYLSDRARSLGIPLLRKRLSSLDEAYNLPELGPVDIVVNASGLGAKTLIGVEDRKVYPARGQTVLARTPKECKRVCVMSAEDFYASNDGEWNAPLLSSLISGSGYT